MSANSGLAGQAVATLPTSVGIVTDFHIGYGDQVGLMQLISDGSSTFSLGGSGGHRFWSGGIQLEQL